MKISVITVCYNSASTLETAVKSVLAQDYKDLEYIIIDGGSKDNTREVLGPYMSRISRFVSEPDKGIYDAINKGISMATGEVVGLLHSDDFYPEHDIISTVAKSFEKETDAVYGDLQYVHRSDTSRVIRNWISGDYKVNNFYNGWMPPHPTFFCRLRHFKELGGYSLELRSAADYELMLRFLFKHKLRVKYIPEVLVKMRVGGKSNVSLSNRIKANLEDRKAWKMNGLKPKFYTLTLKPLSKILQFFR